MNVSPLSSPSVPADDDIVILETVSTPKPNKANIDLNRIKTENQQSDADINMLMECSDDAAVDDLGTSSTESPGVASNPSPAPPPDQASTETQTEMLKVKKEDEDQSQAEKRAGQSTANKDGLCEKDAWDIKFSPAEHASITEVQKQQDQLLQLMQETAQERDLFKEQVGSLTCQLKNMERRLQELSQISVKKECSHQTTQTDETVEKERMENYKLLFEKAKQKIDELIKEKGALLTSTGSMSSTDPCENTDDIALQVDHLLRELDQTNKEKDQLRAQVSVLFVRKHSLHN